MSGGGFIILLYATNMVLKGLCRNIEVYESWDLLNIMKKIDIQPDIVSYNTIITGLCKERILDKGTDLIFEMEGSNCELVSFTYCILIDGINL